MRPRTHRKAPKRLPRIFAPGGEYATPKGFADALREAELVRIHQWGI
jgi:hypothetical protein